MDFITLHDYSPDLLYIQEFHFFILSFVQPEAESQKAA
jgi:hypothetical protein